MLTHLYTTYTNTTLVEIIDKNARLKTAYDENQPIEIISNKSRMLSNMRMQATIPTPYSKS